MCESEVETTDKENQKVIESSNDEESQTSDAIVAVESLEIMSIFPSIVTDHATTVLKDFPSWRKRWILFLYL